MRDKLLPEDRIWALQEEIVEFLLDRLEGGWIGVLKSFTDLAIS
jgi:hypothetical protein